MYQLFFFNDTATTEIYTLSLHDALPIFAVVQMHARGVQLVPQVRTPGAGADLVIGPEHDVVGEELRSEEHTSELQSRLHLVCRFLREKKRPPTHHCQPC